MNDLQLGKCVADNVLAFDQKFWMRLASRNDSASSPEDKNRYELSSLYLQSFGILNYYFNLRLTMIGAKTTTAVEVYPDNEGHVDTLKSKMLPTSSDVHRLFLDCLCNLKVICKNILLQASIENPLAHSIRLTLNVKLVFSCLAIEASDKAVKPLSECSFGFNIPVHSQGFLAAHPVMHDSLDRTPSSSTYLP